MMLSAKFQMLDPGINELTSKITAACLETALYYYWFILYKIPS